MILTVTPNAALDRIMFVDELITGKTHYPDLSIDAIGGKGFDVSLSLKCLQHSTLAMGFIAGEVGKKLVRLLDAQGIPHALTWVKGETRIAHVIVETRKHHHTHITTRGFAIDEKETQTFFQRFSMQIKKTDWLVVAGTLASGLDSSFYQILINKANQYSVPSLIDSKGEPVLKAIVSKPTILKMNRSEFQDTFRIKSPTIDKLGISVRKVLVENELSSIVITCGEDGVLAVLPEKAFRVQCPAQVEVNAAGAGDAVSAGLVSWLANGKSWEDALRWATAAGAATVLTQATAECHLEDVERLFKKTKVERLKPR